MFATFVDLLNLSTFVILSGQKGTAKAMGSTHQASNPNSIPPVQHLFAPRLP
jgi:hypothetical protein